MPSHRRRRHRRLLVSRRWLHSRIATETASSTRAEARLDHYGPGMEVRQAVVVHTAEVGEDRKTHGVATAVWWGQDARSRVGVVERREQRQDRTSAAALGVDTGLIVC